MKPLNHIARPCLNDTVIGFASINAIELQSSQIETIHRNLTFSEQAFQDFVKPLLQRTADTFLAQPDPALPPQTDSPLDFTRVYTGHVDSGGSSDLIINVDAGLSVGSFALYDASRSVTTSVRGASGNVIQLSPEANGFIQIDDPSSLFYLGYDSKIPNRVRGRSRTGIRMNNILNSRLLSKKKQAAQSTSSSRPGM